MKVLDISIRVLIKPISANRFWSDAESFTIGLCDMDKN